MSEIAFFAKNLIKAMNTVDDPRPPASNGLSVIRENHRRTIEHRQNLILECLKNHPGGMKISSISAYIDGCCQETARKTLLKLKKDKKVGITGNSRNTIYFAL